MVLEGVIDDSLAGFGASLKLPVAPLTTFRGGVEIPSVRPVDLAAAIQTPVLIGHGDADDLIPLDRGKALFEAFRSPQKQWETVEGGTHQNVLTTPEAFYARMATFLLSKE